MIWTSPLKPIAADDSTVSQELERAVAARPEHRALIDGPSGAGVSFLELLRRIEKIAAWFRNAGLGPGECLTVWAPNVPPVAATSLAALRLGAAVTGVSPSATQHEVARQIAMARSSMLVTVPSLAEQALAVAKRVVVIGEAPGAVPLCELLACTDRAPASVTDPDAIALLPFSSGTSGLPKGVVLTHRQVVAVCRQIAAAAGIGGHDVTLAVAPWFHIMGITAELLVPLIRGATVITAPRFDPGSFLEDLRRYEISYIVVPPPVAAVLARHPDLAAGGLGHLELVGVGGAPLPIAVQLALADRLPGCAVGQGWGLTEMSGAICVPGRPGGTAPGTVGGLLPSTELRVVEPDSGRELGVGDHGELQARGPQLMQGYLGDPAATTAMITKDGWLHTGDLGRVDAAGNVVVVDRLKDLIKVNALPVAPAEVEAVLAEHPDVLDAAVVGQPDETTGEVPIAYVVGGARLAVAEVSAWAAERLAPYKRPRTIHLVDRLPRTPSGKLLRRELRTAPPR